MVNNPKSKFGLTISPVIFACGRIEEVWCVPVDYADLNRKFSTPGLYKDQVVVPLSLQHQWQVHPSRR